MNRNNGLPPACASCKQQRKKCDQACDMAPYFPANRFQEFQHAHKLFGMSNIVKLMHYVEPHQKRDTAESILMEARLRAEDPASGCLGIVKDLTSQIKSCEDELNAVNQQLAVIRERAQKKKKLFDPKQFPLSAMIEQYYLDNASPNAESDEKGDKKASDNAYNYQSTIEEALAVEHFDINSLIPLMESNYQIDPKTIASIKKHLDKRSDNSKIDIKEMRPIEYGGEDEEERESGSPNEDDEELGQEHKESN